jgi:hypothetical protein
VILTNLKVDEYQGELQAKLNPTSSLKVVEVVFSGVRIPLPSLHCKSTFLENSNKCISLLSIKTYKEDDTGIKAEITARLEHTSRLARMEGGRYLQYLAVINFGTLKYEEVYVPPSFPNLEVYLFTLVQYIYILLANG